MKEALVMTTMSHMMKTLVKVPGCAGLGHQRLKARSGVHLMKKVLVDISHKSQV